SLPVALGRRMVPREIFQRFADLFQTQPHTLGGTDERDPAQYGTRVPPLVPRGTFRVDQPFVLVESQCRLRYTTTFGYLPDAQHVRQLAHDLILPLLPVRSRLPDRLPGAATANRSGSVVSAPVNPQTTARSPLRHVGFRMLLTGIVGLFAGYTLLLPVVPLWVVTRGGSEFVAGAVTGVFMAATVLTQLTVPAQARRWGYRAVSITGAVLLGLPSPLLLLATSWPGILAISLVRGIGFGLITVCGSALIAELLSSSALGRG